MTTTPHPTIEALRQRLERLEGHRGQQTSVVPSGLASLDALLPDGGLRRGTLVEWLAGEEGLGATSLALTAAREASREGGAVVVLDRERAFYPPAAVRLGIDPQRLILVTAVTPADDLWALDQSLRSSAVAAVLAWPERLDGKTFRRLQLAAEAGGALGLLVRPAVMRHEPSWADVRLLVAGSGAGRLEITLLRCRRGADDRSFVVERDDESDLVHQIAAVAHPATRRRA